MTLETAIFMLVDVQGKLADLMHDRDALFQNLKTCVSGMLALEVPVIWVEQIPEKMGSTIEPVRTLLSGHAPIPKKSFSCCGEELVMKALRESGKKQVVIGGIETHVCVYQTAADLIRAGFEVEIVSDAVSSRTQANKTAALERICAMGAGITTTEMMLLDLLKTSEHPKFRDILKLIK